MNNDTRAAMIVVGQFVVATTLAFTLLGLILAGVQWARVLVGEYSVRVEALRGEAELARATQNRLIKVEEARAHLEAANLLNMAEVERARGLAEATGIVADSFGGSEAYLRYLWIQSISNDKGSIIYIPTEANMPILEAGRLLHELPPQ